MHNQIIGKRRDNGITEVTYGKDDFSPDEVWEYWLEIKYNVEHNRQRGWNNSNTQHTYNVLYLCDDRVILETCNQY
jgi:hypothetical protein